MKIYQSPLFIFSTFLLVYGLYLLTNKGSGPEGWGILLAIPMTIVAIVGMVLHFFIAAFLLKKKWHSFLTELLILFLFFLFIFLKFR